MWRAIKPWFKDSETIFWARLQVLVGAAVAVATTALADPAINAAIQSVLDAKYVPYYVIAFGLVTEILRRHRATDL